MHTSSSGSTHEFATAHKPRFGFNTDGNVIHRPENREGRNITIIAATDAKGGIGKKGGMPWVVSEDMRQFKRLTMNHPVVMGRKTFESLGNQPLNGRVNIVLASNVMSVYDTVKKPHVADVIAFSDLKRTMAIFEEQAFIIGGGHLYESALAQDLVDDMILTRFSHDAECDVFFPAFNTTNWHPPIFSTHQLAGGLTMRYEYWQRKRE